MLDVLSECARIRSTRSKCERGKAVWEELGVSFSDFPVSTVSSLFQGCYFERTIYSCRGHLEDL